MEIAIWVSLGIVAGIIAKLSLPRSPAPPPLRFLPADDESVGMLVAPVSNRRGILLPSLLGIAAAVAGGVLGIQYEVKNLLGLGSTWGVDTASVLSAACGALVALVGYRIVAGAIYSWRERGDFRSLKTSSRLLAVSHKRRAAQHVVRA